MSATAYKKIKSFEDACKINGSDPAKLLRYENPSTKEELSENAFVKLREIFKAANGTWQPDFTDHNQLKYFPWFVWDTKKGGFVLYCVDGYYTSTSATSRLCSHDSDIAEYIATKFISIYNEYL